MGAAGSVAEQQFVDSCVAEEKLQKAHDEAAEVCKEARHFEVASHDIHKQCEKNLLFFQDRRQNLDYRRGKWGLKAAALTKQLEVRKSRDVCHPAS